MIKGQIVKCVKDCGKKFPAGSSAEVCVVRSEEIKRQTGESDLLIGSRSGSNAGWVANVNFGDVELV